MGIKGDKSNHETALNTEVLLAKLEPIDGITSKKMFGGHGIFHNDKMFGIVDSKGQYYIKADDSMIAEYESKGSHRHGKMPYYSIPDDVISNHDLLINWVNKSIMNSK